MAVTLTACSAGTSVFNAPPPVHVGAPVTYLDVFDPDNVLDPSSISGYSAALVDGALPAWTTAYEADPSGPALYDPADGLSQVAQLARRERPTVVTIAYGMTAALDGVSSGQFATALGSLLSTLEHSGTTTVLLANLVPANLAPDVGGSPGVTADLAAYNRAIAAAARRPGVTLVNLHSALEAAVGRSGAASIFATGPLGLTNRGQQIVDQVFMQAIRGKPLNAKRTRAA